MAATEIRITGFGGQGVILCGYIIGKAASIYSDHHATLTQSFGPEARGSACSAQVVVNASRVLYPYVTSPSILVAMSRDGYQTHKETLTRTGTLIYDQDLVELDPAAVVKHCYGIPATRIAEELGRKIVSNIVMLGFFGAVTELLEKDAMRQAVESSVPEGTQELNLKAFDIGWEQGIECRAAEKKASRPKLKGKRRVAGTAAGG
jgi:2-oxoglutarate ferredoxin oxidoreductase subunit gamma